MLMRVVIIVGLIALALAGLGVVFIEELAGLLDRRYRAGGYSG